MSYLKTVLALVFLAGGPLSALAAPASPLLWTLVGVVLGAVAALGVASRRPQRAVAG